MSENETKQEDQHEQTLMDHLIELRDRLLHMVLAILIVFIALFAFSEDIFTINPIGPVIGAHTGVNTLAIFYIGNERFYE